MYRESFLWVGLKLLTKSKHLQTVAVVPWWKIPSGGWFQWTRRRQESPSLSASVLSQPLTPHQQTALKITPTLFATISQTALQYKSAKISVLLNEESESEAPQMVTVPYLPKEEVVDLARGPMFLKFKPTVSLSTIFPFLNISGICSNQWNKLPLHYNLQLLTKQTVTIDTTSLKCCH